jgi:hypothetical protein
VWRIAARFFRSGLDKAVIGMIGFEPFVVGYLASWVMRKVRRVGERADGRLDEVVDARVDRLCDLVLGKLGAEPAVQQLEREAAEGVDSERTRLRLQLAVEEAAEQDTEFADTLRSLVEEIRGQSREPSGHGGVVINARADGDARMSVQGSGVQHNTFGGSGGV